jgi:hypothetical protein
MLAAPTYGAWDMEAKRAEMKDGLSIEAHNLQYRWNFLHPAYRVEQGGCKWVRTGPLEILKIICIDDEGLFFRGRCDRLREKNTAKDTLDDALDFDLFLPDGTKSEDFRMAGADGQATTRRSWSVPPTPGLLRSRSSHGMMV